MKPKTKIVKPTVMSEFFTGPQPGNVRKCALCRQEFAEGENWMKMTRVGEYAIGAHTA